MVRDDISHFEFKDSRTPLEVALNTDAEQVMQTESGTSTIRDLLDRPLSTLWCCISWFASTGLFVVIVQFLGGPALGDSAESVYSTWSIAHLNLACAYPPSAHAYFPPNASPFASVAPLYPILSAIASAIARVGHSVAFPTTSALGANCSHAYVAIYRWSLASDALSTTLKFAYLGWFVLLAGVVVVLRASGRGHNGWEAVTLLTVALASPVYTSVSQYFHPQDLLAMGLILLAIGSALKSRWVWAGVLIGLSFTSQQYALLALAPLIVVVPANRRARFLCSTALSIAVIDGPFIIASAGRAFKTVLMGSSRLGILGSRHFHAYGGTVLFASRLRGVGLFVVARALPVVFAVAIALWAYKRLGPRVLEIEALLSLLATTLALRLAFEENLYGYYFMALTVLLLCGEDVRRRMSGKVLTWIGMVLVAFTPIPWFVYLRWEPRGLNLFMALPVLFEVIAVGSFLVGIRRRQYHWYLLAASVIVALTCFPPIYGNQWSIHSAPSWIWQIILVPTGLYLASDSLRTSLRDRRVSEASDSQLRPSTQFR